MAKLESPPHSQHWLFSYADDDGHGNMSSNTHQIHSFSMWFKLWPWSLEYKLILAMWFKLWPWSLEYKLIMLLIVTFQGSTVASQAGTDVAPYSIQFKTAPVAPGAVRKDAGDVQKTVGSWKEEVARGNKSQKWILVRRAIDAVGDIWLPEGALSPILDLSQSACTKSLVRAEWLVSGSCAHSLFGCLLF